MGVGGYILEFNGGSMVNKTLDVGLADIVPDSGGKLGYLAKNGVDGLTIEGGVEYSVRRKAYDDAHPVRNYSDWSEPELYTTPAFNLLWTAESYIDPYWDLGLDGLLTANTDAYSGYGPTIITKLHSIGDYVEFTFPGNAAGMAIYCFEEGASYGVGHYVIFLSTGQVNNQDGFIGYLNPAYTDDDLVRITKTSSDKVSCSINGSSPVEVAYSLISDFTLVVLTLAITGNVIGVPTTNIPPYDA